MSDNQKNDAGQNKPQASKSSKLPFKYSEDKLSNLIAIVAALLFVVGIGFLAYDSFLNDQLSLPDLEKPEITQQAASSSRDSKTSTIEQQNSSNILGEQINGSLQGLELKQGQNTKTLLQGEWQATDYKKGDIERGTYTVKAGDTLWEIAEAVYGDGGQWTTILQANSGDVGYLPSGQQALIYTGQVLVIP